MTADEERAVQAARVAVARELQVDASTLELLSIEPRDWSDTSLGCPQPGTAYAQVITPGYIVVLSSDGVQHTVHTDTRGQAVVCDSEETLGTAVPTEIVGTFTRTGGFAGITQEVTVYSDGTVRIGGDDTKSTTISRAQLTVLRSLFKSRDWRVVGDNYGNQMPDGLQYVISGGGKKVTTYDGATQPAIVGKVMTQFFRIVNSSTRLP